jgi:hypothetical protein
VQPVGASDLEMAAEPVKDSTAEVNPEPVEDSTAAADSVLHLKWWYT